MVDADGVLRAKCAAEAVAAIRRVGGYPYPPMIGAIAARLYETVRPEIKVEIEQEAVFALLADAILRGLE